MVVLPLLGYPSPSLCWSLLAMLENLGSWGEIQSRNPTASSSLRQALLALQVTSWPWFLAFSLLSLVSPSLCK